MLGSKEDESRSTVTVLLASSLETDSGRGPVAS